MPKVKDRAKPYVRILYQFHYNAKWKEFLDSLPSQKERDVAGLVMDWIKTEYPELREVLNGELIHEEEEIEDLTG